MRLLSVAQACKLIGSVTPAKKGVREEGDPVTPQYVYQLVRQKRLDQAEMFGMKVITMRSIIKQWPELEPVDLKDYQVFLMADPVPE